MTGNYWNSLVATASTSAPPPSDDLRTVYFRQDGEYVPVWECDIGEATLTCYIDGEFEYSVLNQEWPQLPLPDGMLVDTTPYGMWVIDGDEALPVDYVSLQYADSAISVDEFEAIMAPGPLWPASLYGVGWEYFWIALAVVVALVVGAGILVWRMVVSRRRTRAASRNGPAASAAA